MIVVLSLLFAAVATAAGDPKSEAVNALTAIGADLDAARAAQSAVAAASRELVAEGAKLSAAVAAMDLHRPPMQMDVAAVAKARAAYDAAAARLQKAIADGDAKLSSSLNAARARHDVAMNAIRNMKG